MNKKCLWCIHDVAWTENKKGKKLRVCVNRASGKFKHELDVLEDGCEGFEEEKPRKSQADSV